MPASADDAAYQNEILHKPADRRVERRFGNAPPVPQKRDMRAKTGCSGPKPRLEQFIAQRLPQRSQVLEATVAAQGDRARVPAMQRGDAVKHDRKWLTLHAGRSGSCRCDIVLPEAPLGHDRAKRKVQPVGPIKTPRKSKPVPTRSCHLHRGPGGSGIRAQGEIHQVRPDRFVEPKGKLPVQCCLSACRQAICS